MGLGSVYYMRLLHSFVSLIVYIIKKLLDRFSKIYVGKMNWS